MAGDPGALSALITLIPLLERQPVRGAYAVVGGMALQLWFGLVLARTTFDVDLIVQVNTWDEYEHLATQLVELGWRRGSDEHRFVTADGRIVDLLPYSLRAIQQGRVVFPRSRASLPAIGLMEAVLDAREIQLTRGVRVRVATVEHLAALKSVAYYERLESRDARDVTLLCRRYGKMNQMLGLLQAGEVSTEMEARGLLLARAIHGLVPGAIPMVVAFAERLSDSFGPLVSRLYREFSVGADEETFRQELAAIGLGLRAGIRGQPE